MPEGLPPLNLFDGLFLGGLLLATSLACARGFAKETLHTLLFLTATVAATLYMLQSPATPQPPAQAALNLAMLFLAAYTGIMVLMRLLRPLVMKDIREVGLRSRLSAGGMAFAKIIAAALFVHVWYIAHTPLPHPERLEPLPELIKNSTLVYRSDGGWAQSLYTATVTAGLLTPALNSSTTQPEPTREEALPTNWE